MNKTFFTYILAFFAVILLQVAVLNNISIGGYATPLLYFYLILKLPSSLSSNWVITLGFLCGLCVDIFCNTPGMHALATGTAAFIRHPVLALFQPREEAVSAIPSAYSLGTGVFLRYAGTMILIHNGLVYTIESFSFFHPLSLMLKIAMSSVLTFLLILGVESLNWKVR